jgi:N-acetylglutamate synthase-like GNAT family acetyltransferase
VTECILRPATAGDAAELHALVTAHIKEGHLLPRDLAEIERHASRFVVCEHEGEIKACAELAPLSTSLAEVRSLVVAGSFRRTGLAGRMLGALRGAAQTSGFETLCAFTHDARFFVRQGFSIVPHLWLSEKIARDCVTCPLFRRCSQFAMMLALTPAVRDVTLEADARRVAVA